VCENLWVTGRRRSRRFELQLAAHVFYTGQPAEQGRLSDMSAGGAMVLSPLQAPFGTQLYIRFVLEPDTICEAWGHVLRSLPFGDSHGLAVEFSKLNDPFKNFLHNLASAVADEQSRFLDDVCDLTVELLR
jgi:hypothetical protein